MRPRAATACGERADLVVTLSAARRASHERGGGKSGIAGRGGGAGPSYGDRPLAHASAGGRRA